MTINVKSATKFEGVHYQPGLQTLASDLELRMVNAGIAVYSPAPSQPLDGLTDAQKGNSLIKSTAGVGGGKIYDENANEIVLSGGSSVDENSKVATSISASEKAIEVTNRLYVSSDSTATTAATRLLFQADNRDETVIINPPTNTVTMRVGLKQSDNVTDANGSFTESYTIAPGKQRRFTYDHRQLFIKQNQVGAVADQYVIAIERFGVL